MTTKVSSRIPSSRNPVQAKFSNFTVVGQLGYAPFRSRRSKSRCLRIRASVSGAGGGLGSSSQDGNSAVEDEEKEEKKGLLLGTEMDGSGSVVRFNLIPQSGMYLCVTYVFGLVLCFGIWVYFTIVVKFYIMLF